jgi:hypothetical protein
LIVIVAVRRGVRRLVLFALIGTLVLVVAVPRLIDAWLGYTMPLGWFLGGAAVATVIMVAAIIRGLTRLTGGLAPAAPRM